jgi:hypothetical protein
MKRLSVQALKTTLLIGFFAVFLSGCGNSMVRAIDSKDLTTSVKMSDTIFLEPVGPEKQVAYLKVRNTSDQQSLSADQLHTGIAARLEAKGFTITRDPNAAHYRIDANILSATLVDESLTADAAVIGGFGGAVMGADRGLKTAAAGGILGAAAGAVVGSMFKVKNYALIVDVQVSEKFEGGVQSTSVSDSRSGGATGRSNTHQVINRTQDFYHHRTRIAATAKQTNLEFEEAAPVLSKKLIASLSGIF